jgi:HD-GYP domain-containing protein (c-di-GMP phosphodiesterase class II)
MVAKDIVEGDAGRHFDPAIVEAFQRRFGAIVRMQEQVEDRWPVVQGAQAFSQSEIAEEALPR